MNIYLRSLGFKDMNSSQEKRFLKDNIKKYIEQGLVLKHEMFNRGVVVIRVSESTGLYIYGRYEGKRFIYEYYFPFVMGKYITNNEEITIERHLDKESFAVVCDEIRTGVTLIFYLQNVMDYMNFISKTKGFSQEMYEPDKKNAISRIPLKQKKTVLTALALSGIILLPINRPEKNRAKARDEENNRRNLIAAAKRGDEQAIENLTIEDLDTYTQLSNRIMYEDVFTIVDSTFMPCGVECDQYSVVGEILELREEYNEYTEEKIYIMSLECNNLIFTMAINSVDLMGEPAVGRRFKGQIWLQGTIKFN